MTVGKYYDMEDEEWFDDQGALVTDFQLRASDMTLRDHFAGQAMVGMLAAAGRGAYISTTKAYEYADQMMKARNETR